MLLVINTKQDPWQTYCKLSLDLIEHCENMALYTGVENNVPGSSLTVV